MRPRSKETNNVIQNFIKKVKREINEDRRPSKCKHIGNKTLINFLSLKSKYGLK